MDCGFLRRPTHAEFETIFLKQDKLLVILPEDHPMAACERFPVSALCDYPFMLLEKGAKAEVSEIFERNQISPKIHFTTWDDYAIMSMVVIRSTDLHLGETGGLLESNSSVTSG